MLGTEHAELLVTNPGNGLIKSLRELFFRSHSTEPVGDYFAGTNHVYRFKWITEIGRLSGWQIFWEDTSIISYSENAEKADPR